jgi:hypothetical protein
MDLAMELITQAIKPKPSRCGASPTRRAGDELLPQGASVSP